MKPPDPPVVVATAWRQDPVVWDDAFAAWLTSVRSEHTRATYRTSAYQFIFWRREPDAWRARVGKRGQGGRIPEYPLSSIAPWTLTTSDVERYQTALEAAKLSAATANLRIAALSALFEYCRTEVIRGVGTTPEALIATNPAGGIVRPKIPPRKRVVLTAPQARALIRHQPESTVPGLRNRALLTCHLYTGLPDNEIRNLRWGDFSVADDGAVRLFWTGKGQSDVTRKVRPLVYSAVCAYLGAAGKLPGLPGDAYIFTPLSTDAARLPNVFQVDIDRPLSRQRVNAIIHHCAQDAGLNAKLITAHTLRRTAATLFYEASGYDIKATQDMLNHARLETTLRYVNQERVDTDAVWQTIEEWFGL